MSMLRSYGPQILLFAACLGLILAWQMGVFRGPHPLLGKKAPSLKLDLLQGGILDLAQHQGTDVVVLDFFATWCPPCRKGLPILARVAESYKGKGVAVYAVNMGEDPDTVKAFVAKTSLTLPVAMDARHEGAVGYEVSTIPQTVIVGKDGVVQEVHIGLGMGMERSLHKSLDTLLAGKRLVEPAPEP
jgi:thiol-disulfide isomerase/thioredoxin